MSYPNRTSCLEIWGYFRVEGIESGIAANANSWGDSFLESDKGWTWGLQGTFGPHPNNQAEDFNFKREVEQLPFKPNLGEIPLGGRASSQVYWSVIQWWGIILFRMRTWVTVTIYPHILTSTNELVYYPHHMISWQLQGGVCRYVNKWLHQGIIHPSTSPYASEVVIVRKKSGDICLCMDYRKLNTITIQDVFPVPCIDEALQVVHERNVFTSFDLAQGYLQLDMEGGDIKKTTFRAGSLGLYEFTFMPFGLSVQAPASAGYWNSVMVSTVHHLTIVSWWHL